MKTLQFALPLALLLSMTPVAEAADLLGTRTVAYGSETDVIPVPGRKRYGGVQICVHKASVRFSDLDIVFGNGGKQDVTVRAVIPKGSCTRWINLKGPRRNIVRIVLRYDTFGNSGPRAVVTARGQ